MQDNNVLTNEYMSVSERFADVVNVGVFGGKQIISPEQIQEIDTVSNVILKNKTKTSKETSQQYRDVLRAVVCNANFCIIGLENQKKVHYVFPVRNMMYDAAAYKKQWNKIQKMHKKKKDLKGAEYLSGFSKNDSLQAVVTLVVYYGTEEWDGAKDIHSLIDWTDMPEEFKEVVPNYSIYLLELNKYENLEDFHSDVKTVCRFLQNSNDEKKLEEMLEEYSEEFEDMEEDTYDLISTLGNITQVEKLKNKYKKEDGGYDMCKGMEDWLNTRMKEGLELGRSEGIQALIETCQEFGLSREDTLSKVQDKFALEKEKAEEYLVKYWK